MKKYNKPISESIEMAIDSHILDTSGFNGIYGEESDGTDGMGNQKDFPWQEDTFGSES